MPGIIAVGSGQYCQLNGTTPVVTSYTPNTSNTFSIINESTTITIYAAIYNSETLANAFVRPSSTNTTVVGAVGIPPSTSLNLSGNFGAQNTNTIYICVVGQAADTSDCVITPIRD
jgi:hypothetical protein